MLDFAHPYLGRKPSKTRLCIERQRKWPRGHPAAAAALRRLCHERRIALRLSSAEPQSVAVRVPQRRACSASLHAHGQGHLRSVAFQAAPAIRVSRLRLRPALGMAPSRAVLRAALLFLLAGCTARRGSGAALGEQRAQFPMSLGGQSFTSTWHRSLDVSPGFPVRFSGRVLAATDRKSSRPLVTLGFLSEALRLTSPPHEVHGRMPAGQRGLPGGCQRRSRQIICVTRRQSSRCVSLGSLRIGPQEHRELRSTRLSADGAADQSEDPGKDRVAQLLVGAPVVQGWHVAQSPVLDEVPDL